MFLVVDCNLAPRSHKMAKVVPRWPQDGPRWPKDGSIPIACTCSATRKSNHSPERPQDDPKRAQDGPNRPQDASPSKVVAHLWPTWTPKGAPRAPQVGHLAPPQK